jgi:hypothetical protein
MVELECLSCGSGYVTLDERFWVARNGRGWDIAEDAGSGRPLATVRTLRDAEAWIAEWVEADHG